MIEAIRERILSHVTPERLVRSANLATEIRHKSAPYVAAALAVGGVLDRFGGFLPDSTRHLPAIYHAAVNVAVGTLVVSDAEGFLIRTAKGMEPSIENPGGGERDHRADKAFLDGILIGHMAESALRGDGGRLGVIGLTFVLNKARNAMMARTRTLAEEHMISTDAIGVNKLKTVIQLADACLALSSRTHSGPMRTVTHLGSLLGVGVGIYGHRVYRQQVHDKISGSPFPA